MIRTAIDQPSSSKATGPGKNENRLHVKNKKEDGHHEKGTGYRNQALPVGMMPHS